MNDAVALVMYSTVERMRHETASAGNIMFSIWIFLVSDAASSHAAPCCVCCVSQIAALCAVLYRVQGR